MSLRYLITFAAAAILAFVVAAAFIDTVDPYLLAGRARIAGFNEKKPFGDYFGREARVQLASSVHPTQLLLGNSRVEIGFDPSTLVISPDERVFCAGVPGERLSSLVSMFQRISATAPLKRVYVGLDYIDFVRNRSTPPVSKTAKADPEGTTLERGRWLMQTSASLSALLASVVTVWSQRDPNTDTLTDRGFNPMFGYDVYYRSIGQTGIFREYVVKIARSFKERATPDESGDVVQEQRDALRRFAALARQRHFELAFFIYPLHVDSLEVMARAGHWQPFLKWRADIAKQIDDLNREFQSTWRLYDFVSYRGIASEATPGADDRKTRMTYWIEPGHFRPIVGRAIFERMNDDGADDEFGTVLTPGNVALRNEGLSQQQQSWRASHLDDVRRLAEWMGQ